MVRTTCALLKSKIIDIGSQVFVLQEAVYTSEHCKKTTHTYMHTHNKQN